MFRRCEEGGFTAHGIDGCVIGPPKTEHSRGGVRERASTAAGEKEKNWSKGVWGERSVRPGVMRELSSPKKGKIAGTKGGKKQNTRNLVWGPVAEQTQNRRWRAEYQDNGMN